MLEKYQNNIHDIIDKLDLKNKFINIDGYDTVSLDILKNWYIKDVITSTGKLRKCLIGRSDYLWNEEVENQIIDIRKKCIDKFGLDIILLDLDDEEFDLYIKYHLATCERKELLGASSHILDILKK